VSSAKSVDLFVYVCDTHHLQLRKAVYAIKNSTTIILPEWFAVLDQMATLSKSQSKKMRKYEIEDYKWEIVRQLADILKVNWFSFHT